MKRSTIKKRDAAAKSGAGGVILTRLDNLVLDAIGRDGAYLNGVGHEAPYPTFTGLSRSTEHGQRVVDCGDSSLNDSSFSQFNQSHSRDNTLSFDNYGKKEISNVPKTISGKRDHS